MWECRRAHTSQDKQQKEEEITRLLSEIQDIVCLLNFRLCFFFSLLFHYSQAGIRFPFVMLNVTWDAGFSTWKDRVLGCDSKCKQEFQKKKNTRARTKNKTQKEETIRKTWKIDLRQATIVPKKRGKIQKCTPGYIFWLTFKILFAGFLWKILDNYSQKNSMITIFFFAGQNKRYMTYFPIGGFSLGPKIFGLGFWALGFGTSSRSWVLGFEFWKFNFTF